MEQAVGAATGVDEARSSGSTFLAFLNTLPLALLALPLVVVGAVIYIPLSLLDRGGRLPSAFERLWYGAVLRVARVRVRVRGARNARQGGSYIIMPNHRSWFDIPVIHEALGVRDIRWVGKKEIMRVPFFGWAFALSRHIAIDRADREKGIRAIRRAAAMSGGGVSIVIFPEGTRSPRGEMLPFKKGGFHLAAETGLEILPLAIVGTERVMRKGARTLHPGTVEVTVCEPLSATGLGKSALPGLMTEVRERIRSALDETPEAP